MRGDDGLVPVSTSGVNEAVVDERLCGVAVCAPERPSEAGIDETLKQVDRLVGVEVAGVEVEDELADFGHD